MQETAIDRRAGLRRGGLLLGIAGQFADIGRLSQDAILTTKSCCDLSDSLATL